MRELSRRLEPIRKPLLLCPVEPLLAMHKAVKDMMDTFYAAGCDTRAIASRLTPFAEYNSFVGLPETMAREARFTRA